MIKVKTVKVINQHSLQNRILHQLNIFEGDTLK